MNEEVLTWDEPESATFNDIAEDSDTERTERYTRWIEDDLDRIISYGGNEQAAEFRSRLRDLQETSAPWYEFSDLNCEVSEVRRHFEMLTGFESMKEDILKVSDQEKQNEMLAELETVRNDYLQNRELNRSKFNKLQRDLVDRVYHQHKNIMDQFGEEMDAFWEARLPKIMEEMTANGSERYVFSGLPVVISEYR